MNNHLESIIAYCDEQMEKGIAQMFNENHPNPLVDLDLFGWAQAKGAHIIAVVITPGSEVLYTLADFIPQGD